MSQNNEMKNCIIPVPQHHITFFKTGEQHFQSEIETIIDEFVIVVK